MSVSVTWAKAEPLRLDEEEKDKYKIMLLADRPVGMLGLGAGQR